MFENKIQLPEQLLCNDKYRKKMNTSFRKYTTYCRDLYSFVFTILINAYCIKRFAQIGKVYFQK